MALATDASSDPGAGEADPKARLVPKGTLIDNKYAIVRVLGEGGMGVVYLAEDVHTGVEVVLKAVRPELVHRKDVLSRTLGEGRTLARIDHPNVVHLNAVVQDETGLWLVMQYIHGESLDQTIKRYRQQDKTVPFTIAIDVFRQILMGVAAAHREGVIHRDLKPANVLVRQKDGVAKVTDFGIAKPVDPARVGQVNTKGVIGSLWYMSPEQVQGRRDLDKRLDVYALGILFFELLTGHVPFTAVSSYDIMKMHVEQPLPKVLAERPELPAWVDEVLARACAKDREQRFSSCEEFLATVEAHVEGQARRERAAVSDVADGADAARSRNWLLWVLLVLSAAGAGLAVWFFLLHDHEPAKKPRPSASATGEPAAPSTDASPSLPGTSASPAPIDPLAKLPGRWKSEAGTDFDAVLVANAVEFRVVDPKQLAPADYVMGEARFILRPGTDTSTFLVEEKMRPQAKLPFDPRSRTSCQEVWTEVDDKPLLATHSGNELGVDFAKMSISPANLKVENGKIVSCVKLRGVARGRGRTVLKRQ